MASKWVAHGSKGRLQCFEMKKFWEHNLDPQVIACFTTHTKPCAVLVRTADGVERAEWTQQDLVVRVEYTTRSPTQSTLPTSSTVHYAMLETLFLQPLRISDGACQPLHIGSRHIFWTSSKLIVLHTQPYKKGLSITTRSTTLRLTLPTQLLRAIT